MKKNMKVVGVRGPSILSLMCPVSLTSKKASQIVPHRTSQITGVFFMVLGQYVPVTLIDSWHVLLKAHLIGGGEGEGLAVCDVSMRFEVMAQWKIQNASDVLKLRFSWFCSMWCVSEIWGGDGTMENTKCFWSKLEIWAPGIWASYSRRSVANQFTRKVRSVASCSLFIHN